MRSPQDDAAWAAAVFGTAIIIVTVLYGAWLYALAH